MRTISGCVRMNESQKQSLSHAIKAVLSDVKEFDVKFKHPFNLRSGKSCFVKTLLHKTEIEPFHSKVILTYKEWQPLYDEMKEQGLVQVFFAWPGGRDEPCGQHNSKPAYIRRPTA